jgi:cyclopropane fatty-acyl-phospholipid synthase-like methyltransferase
MKNDLVRIHHAEYRTDIPFWINRTEGYDPILEIGCGHGRVTLPLLASGREIVGVDNDQESYSYLSDQLRGLESDARQRISLIQTDFLDYTPERVFGAVIIPCNTFSTFNTTKRSKLIRKVFAGLKTEGVFIASIPNPTQTEEILAELHEVEGNEILDQEIVINHPETGFPVQVSSRLRVGEGSLLWDWIYDHLHPDGDLDRVVITIEHFPRSKEELVNELKEGGFREVHCQGDFSEEGYGENSPYLILICRK